MHSFGITGSVLPSSVLPGSLHPEFVLAKFSITGFVKTEFDCISLQYLKIRLPPEKFDVDVQLLFSSFVSLKWRLNDVKGVNDGMGMRL